MAYKISTVEKKRITEVMFWCKDDRTIYQRIGWRFGAVVAEEKPDLSNYNPEEGMDMYSCGVDVEMNYLDDGIYEDWEFPEDMSEEEIEEFQEAYDEDGMEGIENLGWSNDESELWFEGELEVEDY